jgi:ArsR family transcriptional regulator
LKNAWNVKVLIVILRFIKIMGLSKAEEFTIKENKIAIYAKALGHPARVAIIQLLLKQQSCICGDIVDELPLSQSTVSQHLKELKNAGLIKGDIDGAKTCYCIDEKEWQLARQYLGGLLSSPVLVKKCC